jgi:predicted ATPase
MHPRIARLYINNYRCFVNFELRPGRRCLLLGYNGTGKSSIFDVLDGIRTLVGRNADVETAFPRNTVTRFGGSSEQRFEIELATDGGALLYTLHVAHDVDKRSSEIVAEELSLAGKSAYRFAGGEVELAGGDGRARGPFPFSRQRSFLASLDGKARPVIAEFKDFLHQGWSLRLNPASMGATAVAEDTGLTKSGDNFASFCRSALQEAPNLMMRAHEVLQEIIPGFEQLRMHPAGRAKVLVASFRYPGGKGYDIDFDALSDGQKTLIVHYVVLALAAHLPFLCLDEPDNYVSIREIQPFLTELSDVSDETGLQVLMISHSPEVIDYFGPSDAVLLERPDGGHTRVGTLPEGGALRLSEMMARGWLPGGGHGAS